MNVTTKYDADERVYFLYKDKIVQKPIHSIKVEKNPWGLDVSYFVNVGTNDRFESYIVKESQCFETKEELIKSLD